MQEAQTFYVTPVKTKKSINRKVLFAGIAFLAMSIGGILAGIALVGTQQYNKSLASNCPGGSVSACTNICISGCGGSQNPTQCVNGCPGACANICSGGSGYVCGNGVCDAPGETTSNCPSDCHPPATNSPTCAGASQSCESRTCCSGYVCQGNAGSRICQQVQNGSCNSGGARCGGSQGYIGFHCSQLSGGQCNSNPQTFDSWNAATTYAAGCGQADEIWVGGPCNRQLCGNFSIFSSSCSSSQPAPGTTAPKTATPIPTKGTSPTLYPRTPHPSATTAPTAPPTTTPAPSPSATTNAIIAQCFAVKVFDTDWTQISLTDLVRKNAGDTVYFTVGGTTTGGSFDRARFTINSDLRPDVVTMRPGTDEFYDAYVIPEGLTTLNVQAQIHHTTLGWN